MRTMKTAVFLRPEKIVLEEKPIPAPGPGEALVKITTTTISGTDVHILKGEFPVDEGRTIGHEPVGVIAELGLGVTGYEVGQRVIVGAMLQKTLLLRIVRHVVLFKFQLSEPRKCFRQLKPKIFAF